MTVTVETVAVDLNNIPPAMRERAQQLAEAMQDMLIEHKAEDNFIALYAAVLLTGANVAVLARTRDEMDTLRLWVLETMVSYSEQIRDHMFGKVGETKQ